MKQQFIIRKKAKTIQNKPQSDIPSDSRGFSLVEILVGISIMAVLGLMLTSLFGSSTRLYRSTVTYSGIQTESQTVSRRLANAIMEAEALYMNHEETGDYLFLGEVKTAADSVYYSGTMFWYNRETGCLYQNSGFSAEETYSTLNAEKAGLEGGSEHFGERGTLSLETVRRMMEENESSGREYLISDKVTKLEFELFPELTEDERISMDDCYYMAGGKITVNYKITFRYQDSKSYSVDTSASPRNKIAVLWWKEAQDGEGEEEKG